MEPSLNKIAWKGFVEFRPRWAGTGSMITVETSREWGWKSAAYYPLPWRLPWLKIVVVRSFVCSCCLAKALSLCCSVIGVAFSCHWGFLILLAPRVESMTGTEVFHMHPSTAVQFLTLNYPRGVLYHTTKLLVQLRIRLHDSICGSELLYGARSVTRTWHWTLRVCTHQKSTESSQTVETRGGVHTDRVESSQVRRNPVCF